jgi:hypothetical protein
MKTQIDSIELLNFEGPVLVATKTENTYEPGKFIFIITDERKKIIDVFNTDQFTDFLMGVFDLKDSMNRSWNYPSESHEAKPPTGKLYDFIYKKEDDPKDKLIELLEAQVIELSMDYDIELRDSVVAEIKRLKSIINEQN